MDRETGFVICIGCLLSVLAAAGVVLFYRHKERRMYRVLGQMLSDAMEGVFEERRYDETMQSALEARWAAYLSARELAVKRQAEEKEKIKTLIADISHQTKTPIANLLLYSELLLEQELPRMAGEYALSVKEQAQKLNFLIAALVRMSRLETGILVLHPETGSVNELLRRVYLQMRPKAEEKGLELILEETKGEYQAVFDTKWTEEAVVNIVDNAVKYTDQGSVTMGICPFELFCSIQVRDTGAGIPEEEQTKTFSRFYRGTAAGSSDGVGIGLYLAREILSKEGGYIKVSSRPGEGSVFSVYLNSKK